MGVHLSEAAPGWRFASASAVGTAHGATGTPCQDAARCAVFREQDGGEVLVAVASDGAGSAGHSQIGAELACELWLCEMEAYFGGGGSVAGLTREFAAQWVEHYQREVATRAEADGLAPREFAATFLTAVVGERYAVFAQVGDGAIVVADAEAPDEYAVVYWPQRGEYANTTFFLTGDDATEVLLFDGAPVSVQDVALLTDGMERLALDLKRQAGHAPFFRPMFAPLRKLEGAGYSERLSRALGAFLSSKAVNDRTDDDKTLVLATRITPKGEAPPGDAV